MHSRRVDGIPFTSNTVIGTREFYSNGAHARLGTLKRLDSYDFPPAAPLFELRVSDAGGARRSKKPLGAVEAAPFERLHFRSPAFERASSKQLLQTAQQEAEALKT